MADSDRHSEQPDEYLIEHVRDALAQDARLGELHVQVSMSGRKVFFNGEVGTEERRDALTEVASRLLPDHEIHNHTTVSPFPEAPKVERL